MLDQSSVESVTHVIQVALTPVFLLTAVAALPPRPPMPVGTLVLDVAILATIAGVATSGAALILFVGALREAVDSDNGGLRERLRKGEVPLSAVAARPYFAGAVSLVGVPSRLLGSPIGSRGQ